MLFKGSQNILQKAVNKNEKLPLDPSAIPLLKAEELFADEKCQNILDKIPELFNKDQALIDTHCYPLLETVAEFLQRLPETRNSYFSELGGMLTHHLHRAFLAASLCRTYFLPKEYEQAGALNATQTLWTFAAFSAGLLFDIGKIVTDFAVSVFDRNQFHTPAKNWIPWEGNMLAMGTDYAFEFTEGKSDAFRRRATIALARQLIPHQSYLWLASDPDILAAWLGMLEDDSDAGGLIGGLLMRADAEAIRRYFAELNLVKQFEAFERKQIESKLADAITTFGRVKSGSELAKLLAQGDLAMVGKYFLHWAQKNIESGALTANSEKSGVVRVQEGVLLTEKVFQEFVKQHPEIKSVETAMQALEKLNLHEVGANQSSLHQYAAITQQNNSEQQNVQQQTLQGMVIKNPSLIFPPQNAQAVMNFVRVPIGMLNAGVVASLNGQLTQQILNDAPAAPGIGFSASVTGG